MLGQKNRLKRMKDWEILFTEGRFVGGEYMTAKIWQIEPDKYPRRKYSQEDLRVGFAVGLKVSKSAVRRNRVKRQLREIVRLLLKEDKIKIGYHLALLAKPNILGKSYEEIEKDIMAVLRKARVLTI